MRNKKILNGKFDLHVHTNYSRDGISSVEEVLTRAKALGLNGLAITDHDVISGALKALRIADKFGLIVIPGIEITTIEGHILVLGIKSLIPKKLRAVETVIKARDLGGAVIVPHAYDYLRRAIGRVTDSLDVDAVEALNGGEFLPFSNIFARKLAERRKLPMTAGSDAHSIETLGCAYTVIQEEVSDYQDVIHAIKKGKTLPVGKVIRLPRIKEAMIRRKRKIRTN
ncbi:MAG: CehA/McbA family metallohydrolase [Candidatus Wukongarchaeota archaeon]|nr:PHP domain-containing protein [Candidatus Wukongarchaeota archaeon]